MLLIPLRAVPRAERHLLFCTELVVGRPLRRRRKRGRGRGSRACR